MNFLNAFSRHLNRCTEFFLFAFGVSMSGIVVAQVFARYALNHSLFWSEELARYLLVWLTFLGATTAYYRGVHPGVDLIHERLPTRSKHALNILVHLVCITFFGVVIVYGCQFAWFVRMQISPALQFPKWIVLAIIPASGIIFVIHGIVFLFREIGEVRK